MSTSPSPAASGVREFVNTGIRPTSQGPQSDAGFSYAALIALWRRIAGALRLRNVGRKGAYHFRSLSDFIFKKMSFGDQYCWVLWASTRLLSEGSEEEGGNFVSEKILLVEMRMTFPSPQDL